MMVKSDEAIDILDDNTPFMYIFVRNDLPAVVKLIQAAHATYKAGLRFKEERVVHFCVFGLKNETKLKSVAWDLNETGFDFEMFYEPDFDIGHTAIAVMPIVGEKREWFKKFKLLKM